MRLSFIGVLIVAAAVVSACPVTQDTTVRSTEPKRDFCFWPWISDCGAGVDLLDVMRPSGPNIGDAPKPFKAGCEVGEEGENLSEALVLRDLEGYYRRSFHTTADGFNAPVMAVLRITRVGGLAKSEGLEVAITCAPALPSK
ncbi:hypothetical protein M407DRAFT_12788 [Tulasnella calospora MUT 4182]|uniref:Lipoprotein n=1 Tax=Tulasnella calospora MUT 4182 TaxID=1051891 RepID=A0A0C3PPR8_9AGAM|nr:hypothetical protein M407DRAFT_12788 [Tulasnella calospora MUT 4182]